MVTEQEPVSNTRALEVECWEVQLPSRADGGSSQELLDGSLLCSAAERRFTILNTHRSPAIRAPDSVLNSELGTSKRPPSAFLHKSGCALTNNVPSSISVLVKTTRSPPRVTIAMERDSESNRVCISVVDTGSGIPKHERDVIESGTETPLNHSLGIGFWLMEWVATVLGGELIISDNDLEGSVVTFQLPDAT